MVLDDAIKHCLELAEQEECFINYPHSDIVLDDLDIESRKHFVAEQRQLAEWLMDYKDLKAEQNDQYVFIHELMNELKEAKRLLKVAMKDMKILYESGKDEGCVGIEFKWRYADEALKLLNDEK